MEKRYNVEYMEEKKEIVPSSGDKLPAKKNKRLTLSKESNLILEEVYQALGGSKGSVLFWRNREDLFRTMIESKYLVKQALKETNVEKGSEATKNVFLTFIQNNGLGKKEPLPEVEATMVNPELEEKND